MKDPLKYKLERQAASRAHDRQNPRYGNWYLTNNMRIVRQSRHMSQADLAQKIGVSRQTISNIERYRSDPQTSLSIAIAEALDTSLERIFMIRPFPAAPWRKDPWIDTKKDKPRWRRLLSYTNRRLN